MFQGLDTDGSGKLHGTHLQECHDLCKEIGLGLEENNFSVSGFESMGCAGGC
jgi:hypothetical protein